MNVLQTTDKRAMLTGNVPDTYRESADSGQGTVLVTESRALIGGLMSDVTRKC